MIFEYLLLGLAGVIAGIMNALAGGGTLISFPMLLAAGIPPIAANVTNTIALCPGQLGGAFAQSNDLRGQKERFWLFLPTGIISGVIGGVLLINSGEKLFRSLVPFLILIASGLLAVQEPLRRWLILRTANKGSSVISHKWVILPVGIAGIYGGYFGAGLGVITLAVLGLALEDSLTRLNALKQTFTFSVNVSASIFFLFSGQVVWPAAFVMAAGAIIGGSLGGRLAGRVRPSSLRWVVVSVGVAVGIIYLVR
ncbi:MAG: sulfite exporter TauE/SafE family protein [Candidatus Schekmanbacteria bacterium]|nr:sulfite exporter TauE/SafE family protein [Candidatus Schekmanbacteria bacterium]